LTEDYDFTQWDSDDFALLFIFSNTGIINLNNFTIVNDNIDHASSPYIPSPITALRLYQNLTTLTLDYNDAVNALQTINVISAVNISINTNIIIEFSNTEIKIILFNSNLQKILHTEVISFDILSNILGNNLFTSSEINDIDITAYKILNGDIIQNDIESEVYLNNRIIKKIDNKQDNITGAATSIITDNLAINKALLSDSSGKIIVSNITDTELGYLTGVTSDLQTQLNAVQSNITGAASSIITDNLSFDKVLLSNELGKVITSNVTNTELGYLTGVTSGVQEQLEKIILSPLSKTSTNKYIIDSDT
jgi:hypothetical protein